MAKKTKVLEQGAISAYRAQHAKKMKAIENGDMALIEQLLSILPDDVLCFVSGDTSILTQLIENGIAYRTYFKDYETIRHLEEIFKSLQRAWRGFVSVNVKNNILDDNDGDRFISVTFTVVECINWRF